MGDPRNPVAGREMKPVKAYVVDSLKCVPLSDSKKTTRPEDAP
jgi:hypothetical protein